MLKGKIISIILIILTILSKPVLPVKHMTVVRGHNFSLARQLRPGRCDIAQSMNTGKGQ